MYDPDAGLIKKFLIAGTIIVAIIFILLSLPFTIIDAGHRGVVMNYGKVSDTILDEGIHFRTPFVQSVRKVDVRVQKNDVKAEAASRDLQDVNMDIVVNYHIDPKKVNKVYQTIGDNKDVVDRIISPNTNEVVKAATAQFTAEETIAKRQILKDNIDKSLIERLSSYGIILDDVSITNVDFSAEFNAAIESKQVAEQESLKAKFTSDKAVRDAEARVNKAKGESEAQRLQLQSLTPELLQKMWIEKWNGELPSVVSENSPLLQLSVKK